MSHFFSEQKQNQHQTFFSYSIFWSFLNNHFFTSESQMSNIYFSQIYNEISVITNVDLTVMAQQEIYSTFYRPK